MTPIEDLLPREQSFDTMAQQQYENLHKQFDQSQREHGDIFGVDDEMQRNIEDLAQFSRIIAEYLAQQEAEVRPITDAIYRSICFAGLVADRVLPGSYDCQLLAYIKQRMPDEFSMDTVTDDSQDFLQQRPALDALTGYYMP